MNGPGQEIFNPFKQKRVPSQLSNDVLRNILITITVGVTLIIILPKGNNATPPTPQNIRAETSGTDNVTIKWDDAGKDISYQLYISKQSDPNRADPFGNLTTETSKNAYNLSSGTNYYFWVVSVKDGKESTKSSSVSIRTAQTLVQPPPIPKNVRAGTPGTNNVTIQWDNVGTNIDYRIYWHTKNDPTSAKVLGAQTTETSMPVTNLTSRTNYFFWVTSIKDGNESAKSSVVSVLTAQSPAQTSSSGRNESNNILPLNGTTWEYINQNDNQNRYRLSFANNNVITFSIYNRDGSRVLESYKGTYSLQGTGLTIEIVYPDEKRTNRYIYSQSSIVDRQNQSVIYKPR